MFTPMIQLEIAGRLALAFCMGALLGYERAYNKKPAGSRTHALVCLASALFMVISIYGFSSSAVPVDPSRVAAQVVTGMGFIGAGAIWREGSWVKGITSATTLWVASALGLAVGCGLYVPAVIAMVLAWLGLEFYTLERIVTGRDQWLDEQLMIEALNLDSLKIDLETIFSHPIKLSSLGAADPYVVSFVTARTVTDPFTLTLSIKKKTVNLVLLYVPEHLRGKGYARSIVEALLKWARGQAFEQITLTTTPETAGMWEKLGFTSIDPTTYIYRFNKAC